MNWLRCLGIMLLMYPAMAGTVAPATEVIGPAPTTEATQKRRAALEQRVTAKWDALIRKDFTTAYSFTSPEYRKLFSVNAFKGGFGNKVAWQRVEVVNVDFKGDDAATVGINIYFVYHPPQSQRALDMRTYAQESWVLVDGQWWYLVKQ